MLLRVFSNLSKRRPNLVHTPNSATIQFVFLCRSLDIQENRKNNSAEHYMIEYISNNQENIIQMTAIFPQIDILISSASDFQAQLLKVTLFAYDKLNKQYWEKQYPQSRSCYNNNKD